MAVAAFGGQFCWEFFWFLLFWACLGGFVVGLSLFWLGMAENRLIVVDGWFSG